MEGQGEKNNKFIVGRILCESLPGSNGCALELQIQIGSIRMR